MRRILTPQEAAQRDKRRNGIISIILLGILLLSSLGFAFIYASENTTTTPLGPDNQLQNIGGRWVINWGGQAYSFAHSPEASFNETYMNFSADIAGYYGLPLYIDARDEIAYQEILTNIGRYAQRAQYGCYDSCENTTWPMKNCSDNLIVYRTDNENAVSRVQNCVFIQGDSRAIDAFLYREIGIA